MECPSCHKSPLKPTKLDNGLTARKCLKCEGLLIDLLNYRDWRDSQPKDQPLPPPQLEPDEAEDNQKAITCPRCSRLMTKFRINGSQPNRIDVCTFCDTAWLDEGEWELLGALSLQTKLTAIFTDPWQQTLIKELANESKLERIKHSLGEADFNELMRIREWIDQHPRSDDIRRLLISKTLFPI